MKDSDVRLARHTLDGTIRGFLAEALLLPTGLLTAAFLTRRLGPEGYGLFTMAAALVSWIEWSITSLFSRATIKLIGEAEDWQPVAAAVIRLHLAASGGAALLLWLLALPISSWLNQPALGTCLRLFALDIPLFSLAYAQRNILVGIGSFTQRALISASRWTVRLLLIVLLVGLGLSVPGAILGSMGASLVECVIGLCYVRPALFRRCPFPARQLCSYAVPLFLSALCLRLYDKLDLFALTALGGTAEQAGLYGAAQNLSLVPGLIALSFSPLLLSTLSRALHAGNLAMARRMGRDAMRGVIGLLPLAGLTAGAAPEIVRLTLGPRFSPAAPLLALLIFGALDLTMISVTMAILIAAGKPDWTVALTGPLLPLAILGHLLLIPALGALGASLVTATVAGLGALATVVAVYRLWQILPPAGTLWRSALLGSLTYLLAAHWPAPGLWLLIKLSTIVAGTFLGFLLLGEFSRSERDLLRSLFLRPTLRHGTRREI